MLKKSVVLVVTLVLLLTMAGSAMAMLKVLEPEVSEELRGIAKNHLAATHNIEPAAITITDGWVREFWNAKIDVYMIEAVINSGLATEQKIQVRVRVDQKIVLTDDEFNALEAEDERLAPAEPQGRVFVTTTEIEPNAPEADDGSLALESTDTGEASTPYILVFAALAVILMAVLGTSLLRKRRKA
ncbi:MAG TPA: LPXTG cell wall anchor domain-containing protein [Candidatus Limnocylindrales bacterium]|nr:LPXTG cell wall anchor domain-containing protein [Candidatus Limnocylindrales bacterium]